MFAVISFKGNQYKVMPEKEYKIARFEGDDKKIVFSDVMLISDDKTTTLGTPFIKDAKVEAEVLGEAKGEKVEGIKFKAKKRYKRNLGHQQKYIKVKILSISK